MTTVSPLFRSFFYYSIGMSLYGASRGYRSDYQYNSHEKKWEKVNILFGDRLMTTIGSGVIYLLPTFSLIKTVNLINRIHIRQMGWNSEDFPQEYEEFGWKLCCVDTL